MRIAVNTRLLIHGKLEGIGWFTYETFSRMAIDHPNDEFFFIFDRPFNREFIFAKNIHPVVLGPPARHPILWYIWFEFSVNRFLKKLKPDIFISPDGYLSLKANTPQLAVIHDINFYYYPKGLPWLTSLYLNKYFPKFAGKAKRIVTVSEYSKNTLVEAYKVNPQKIDVVYNGASDNFKPLTEIERADQRNQLTDGWPYFVFVGAFSPRKNISSLINAFDMFRRKTNIQAKLVLVGETMFKASSIEAAHHKSKFKDDIIFTGRKGLPELSRIVGAAQALIFPSLFEGFGIPVLEAILCEVPVAASNSTSMPEVAGNAAIYFEPTSDESIAEAMERIWMDTQLRQRLISNARVQRQKFSWEQAASRLYDIIAKTIES